MRQTPGGRGDWQDCQFSYGPAGEVDAWVVVEGLPATQSTVCSPARTIFVTAEPPTQPRYPLPFLAQFAAVVTCHEFRSHPHVIRHQQGLPWWVGVRRRGHQILGQTLDYDHLSAMREVPKTRNLSVICSRVDKLRSHRRRIRFVDRLLEHFGDRIDAFGSGWREIEDKWDAIAPYRYHVAVENVACQDYWTEKLADTFLGGALPLYHGCPNVDRYFDPGSLVKIDIDRPDEAIRIISDAIDEGAYEKAKQLVWASRARVLNEHNFFPMIAAVCKSLPAEDATEIRLRPVEEFSFSLPQRIRTGVMRTVQKAARIGFRVNRRLRGRQ